MTFQPVFKNPARARDACEQWARASGLPIEDELATIVADFLPEFAGYCELVSGPEKSPVGLMTRGEDESFTSRGIQVMRRFQISEKDIDRFASQAALFEHKRAFLKMEWQKTERGIERLVAYYYRRRPDIFTVVQRYEEAGVAKCALDRAIALSRILEKNTTHFVSAALRPGSTAHHKLYFSQYSTPETYDAAFARVERALALFGVDKEHLERHLRLLPRSDTTTFFISMRFTDSRLLPELKVDYPMVPLGLLDPSLQPTARALCAAAGTEVLSFVGVTLAPGAEPRFKLYADLPGNPR